MFFRKKIFLSIISSNCGNEDIIYLELYNYFQKMVEEGIGQEFRLKNIVEIKNYFHEEIENNELMNRRNKNIWKTLNYIEKFLILAATVTGCISISGFASLFGIAIENTSSALELNICAITAGIKKYNSIIKKKKHDKRKLLAKCKLNCLEVFISKALLDSNIIHDRFLIINNVQKDYDNIKEEINV